MSLNIEGELFGYIQRGISSVEVNGDGDLVVILTDGTTSNLGHVKRPVYTLEWHDGTGHPNNAEIAASKAIIEKVRACETGEFDLYLNANEHLLPMMFMSSSTFIFVDFYEQSNFTMYVIKVTPAGSYLQSKRSFVVDEFDDESDSPASSSAIAAYIEERIAANQLQAGNGITISNGVISLSGGNA